VQRRKTHHLPDETYVGNHFVVFITVCTADRGRWLANPTLASLVRDEILRIHTEHPVLAYCLMPDHFHLLLCNSGKSLARIINLLKGRVSRRVRKLEPDLSPWQSGYWDHIVRRDEGLYKTVKYIFLNPVRSGIVSRWWDYQWLGSPMIGEVGPDFFTRARPEDIAWREILAGGP
jgi:REP element-mobilizing transposase RayT